MFVVSLHNSLHTATTNSYSFTQNEKQRSLKLTEKLLLADRMKLEVDEQMERVQREAFQASAGTGK